MDAPLVPPTRIEVSSSTPMSAEKAAKRLDAFITAFGERSQAAEGGSTAVTVQLQKLKDALVEERKHVQNASCACVANSLQCNGIHV
ncbi:hypothetical protein K523DRAFT_345041 [Schizophyllum commune Tattone D]|nr:hypothetical protein K525DRAFT_289265 [Schizophyllum commune Loenen D]KAI5822902.1 hypothetical protein K523DRAFT_345041 [Schizophyllum commune Tattone D]